MNYFVQISKDGKLYKEFDATQIEIQSKKMIFNESGEEIPEGDIISLKFTTIDGNIEIYDVFNYSICVYNSNMVLMLNLEQVM